MTETALNFGPDWIRALTTESTSSTAAPTTSPPKYSFAEFHYGREEMLALIPKDNGVPSCLQQFPHLVRERFQPPLALTPVNDDEQRLWTRSVNSDIALRASGKTPGYGIGRPGRGGSVDRGRGRGRGGYYQRGMMHEDIEEGPSNYNRSKGLERSLSASDKDHRWDDRDRRYDRSYPGRDTDDINMKQETRGPREHWRKYDKDDDGDWRSTGYRGSDKPGGRGSWRSVADRDRRDVPDRNAHYRNTSGSNRSNQNSQLKNSSWKEDNKGRLPEWSVEETTEPDTVGTFDSSGAFLETKVSDSGDSDDANISSDANEGKSKQDSPEAKTLSTKNNTKSPSNSSNASKKTLKKENLKPPNDDKNSGELRVAQNLSENSKAETTNSATKKPPPMSSSENVINVAGENQKRFSVKAELSSLPSPESGAPGENGKTSKVKSVLLSNVKNSESAVKSGTALPEEDAFAYHQKATENMVAQWTEEIEEQRVVKPTEENNPPSNENDNKWFYEDPQGQIQGPFTSAEMLEWFSSGYFTMNLMVRRGCDEQFSQLGALIKSWDRVPFTPGNNPPPLRVTAKPAAPLPAPVLPSLGASSIAAAAAAATLSKPEQIFALQQQMLEQQIIQQQLLLRQAQMQQLLVQLKEQDNFSSLNAQQQQQVLMQQFIAQQVARPNLSEKSSLLDSVNPLSMPLLGLPMPSMMKNDLSMWQTNPGWPLNVNITQPPGGSIWDVDSSKVGSEESEAEKLKKLEEQQMAMKAEEMRLRQERELEEKRLEEMKRKEEETRLIQELQKQEEERKQLEEQRRQEELQRLEEQRRQEEENKRQELIRQEERKRQELIRQEELKRQQEEERQIELKRQEEERRLEELRRKEEEELRLKEEQRIKEELHKQQELRKQEEKRKKEEAQKQLQMEKERLEREKIEQLQEALRQKAAEREELMQREQERREKEAEMKRLAEIKMKSQGPAWGVQNNTQVNSHMSLADIQRIQEEKERQEREEKMRQQLIQQAAIKQVQQTKNGLSWAKRATDCQPMVKSLAEIQQEEAERAVQMQRIQKPQAPPPPVHSNVGVWGNSSHISKITAAPPIWNTNSVATGGFWEDATPTVPVRKPAAKTNTDSAFPALLNPVQPANGSNSKSKHIRAKKEEDAVARLFGSHLKPTDEFTLWCTEAISSMPSSVDVPTFVAFLKDIESPYEVYDYVKSYFGEGKEPKEFARLFLEKRSKYRNQAKQASNEDNTLWGPAPAITPSVNKTTVSINECDGNAKGKGKRRKNRMQKLDSSILGFTVQPNPDRLNAGEIDHIENV